MMIAQFSTLPAGRRIAHALCCVLAAVMTMALPGCSGIEKAPPQPISTRAERPKVQIDVPEILRGTIGSEVVVRGYAPETSSGYRPVIARGYGLVVGLDGTGSRDIAPPLRAYMLAEAARGGFGSERFGDDVRSMTPEELINSPNTAIVIVEGVVPQGAPAGTRFDVRVYAVPGSDTFSLENGTLYTTLLRPGPLAAGGRQGFELASANGPVFVNPFVEPGATGGDAVMRNAGRVLNGGVVTKDMPLKLDLINPSHARAAVLQNAINTLFPQERGQRQPTARGESDTSIDLTVPPSWGDRTEEFMDLLMHSTIAQANPEGVAMSVKRALLANPAYNVKAAALRWQALGPRALPIIRELYDHPEELPRIAALRAGAELDDGLVIPPLLAMAETGSISSRLTAIDLLQDMRTNPQIDSVLRKFLDDSDVEIRLHAYEALVKRGDPFMDRTVVDGKFVLDVVKSSQPLIYVTEMGQPRIAVFGEALELKRPLTVSAWSNRLMIKGDLDDPLVDVMYRANTTDPGVILRTPADLKSFIKFLGHQTNVNDPSPGIDLTYTETVGALYQVWHDKRIAADFKLEQDRILAAIMRVQTEDEADVSERPEVSSERAEGTGDDAAQSALEGMLDGPDAVKPARPAPTMPVPEEPDVNPN
jgi:hypothetical protein